MAHCQKRHCWKKSEGRLMKPLRVHEWLRTEVIMINPALRVERGGPHGAPAAPSPAGGEEWPAGGNPHRLRPQTGHLPRSAAVSRAASRETSAQRHPRSPAGKSW